MCSIIVSVYASVNLLGFEEDLTQELKSNSKTIVDE
jgi:hypothetical protein